MHAHWIAPASVSFPFSPEQAVTFSKYRGTSLTRKRIPLGPYRRPMPRVLRGVLEG